jgi:hypothetical protein
MEEGSVPEGSSLLGKRKPLTRNDRMRGMKSSVHLPDRLGGHALRPVFLLGYRPPAVFDVELQNFSKLQQG